MDVMPTARFDDELVGGNATDNANDRFRICAVGSLRVRIELATGTGLVVVDLVVAAGAGATDCQRSHGFKESLVFAARCWASNRQGSHGCNETHAQTLTW